MEMNRSDRRRQEKQDLAILKRGLDPERRNSDEVEAMARQLHRLLEKCKRIGRIDTLMSFLSSNVDLTLKELKDIPVACQKGCSSCCNIWVSVAPFEALHIAKLIKRRSPNSLAAIRAAHDYTSQFEFEARDSHPHPCPLLEANVCSIYSDRPHSCRLASSFDAEVCARSYLNITDEDIPTPFIYLMARSAYSFAIAAALRRSGFPHCFYELNDSLVRAISRDDAEEAWLRGDDVFEGVKQDPGDTFAQPGYEAVYRSAFSGYF